MCFLTLNLLKKKPKIFTYNHIISHLSNSIKNTNELIYTLGRKNPHLQGMGTTLCVLFFYETKEKTNLKEKNAIPLSYITDCL